MRLLHLIYLVLQHPLHLNDWLVKRGLAQKWIEDFIPFWNTVRPPSLPISDYASYTWLEYFFTQRARDKNPDGDHFEDMDWQYARLLSYVKRREMHPLRMLKVAWTLRRAKTVLEFGAGAAPYAHFIKTAWPTRQTVYTHDLLGTLLQKYHHETFLTENIPFEYWWDGIVCTEVFEHLPDAELTAIEMMHASPLICFDYVDDSSQLREMTLKAFANRGTLTGPDKRGLYIWRR